MAIEVTTSWDGVLLKTLQGSCMIQFFAYMYTKLLPTKTSNWQPLWMSCSWISPPFSIVLQRANTLNHLNISEFCQESFLLIAFVGKATLPSQVAHPSHLL
jgi:hypothetical protein